MQPLNYTVYALFQTLEMNRKEATSRGRATIPQ